MISSSDLESEVLSSLVVEDVVAACNSRRSMFPAVEIVSTNLASNDSPLSFMPRDSTEDAKSSKTNAKIADMTKRFDPQQKFIFQFSFSECFPVHVISIV